MQSSQLANPKLLTFQSLILYVQPFGKIKGGGVGVRMNPPGLICYCK